MKHPTKKQVQVVIDNLKKVKNLANGEAKVNMTQGVVYGPSCGSPMCHGGWYAVSKGHINPLRYSYMSGANAMARDLGFLNKSALEYWAYRNDDIWGNQCGAKMFSLSSAFGVGVVTDLQQIIDHWEGVKERLPQ